LRNGVASSHVVPELAKAKCYRTYGSWLQQKIAFYQPCGGFAYIGRMLDLLGAEKQKARSVFD
jgi:hypothetical protein